jgi:hypothetical protein
MRVLELSTLILLLVVIKLSLVDTFVLQAPKLPLVQLRIRPHAQARRRRTHLKVAIELVFDGSCTLVSDPLPANVTSEQLAKFMRQERTRALFFSAGGTRPVENYEMTSNLRTMWEEIAIDYFQAPSLLPHENDSIISCDSIIQFPGVLLTTTALNGIKIQDDKQSGFPIYTVVGFAERQRVEGTRPVVWLFNQLTGLDKKEKGAFYPTSARACSEISIIDKGESFAFQFNVNLKVVTKVPKVLVRLLPTSKEHVEEQGSIAVANALSKDLKATLVHVQASFLREHS